MRNRARERAGARIPRSRGNSESTCGDRGAVGLLDGLRRAAEGEVMRRFAAAMQFLTVVPVPGRYLPAEGAAAFPLIGAILGVAGAAVMAAVGRALPPNIAALLAL